MNLIINWLKQCSNCFNSIKFHHENYSQLSIYSINIHNLAKHCLHITNKIDMICYKCFLNFFGYDRFIIHHLFIYLNQQQQQQQDTNSIHIKQFHMFAESIINWHEIINHFDFILLLFNLILNKNNLFNINQYNDNDNFLEKHIMNTHLFYELLEDAFFFNAIQSNIQTDLTDSSQVNNFINDAPLIEPGLDRLFTVRLQDLIQNQTNLMLH